MSAARVQWVGSICGHVELIADDDTEYEVGDDEPCVHCLHRGCIATVQYQPPATPRTPT